MEDSVIFSIFAVGGFFVILSYYLLYRYGVFKKVLPVFYKEKWFLYLWIFSVILTVTSVFALIIYYSFYHKLEDWNRTLFIASLSVFLVFAVCWSISMYYIYNRGADFNSQQIVLFIVALSTVGILISVIKDDTPWLIIASAIIVFLHHYYMDALLWNDISKKYYLQDIKKYKKIKKIKN